MEKAFQVISKISFTHQIKGSLSLLSEILILSQQFKYFQCADVNGDGVISVKEYHRILKTNGVSDAEISHLINIIDKNKDG